MSSASTVFGGLFLPIGRKKEYASGLSLAVAEHAKQILEIYYGEKVRIKHINLSSTKGPFNGVGEGEMRYVEADGWLEGPKVLMGARKFSFNHYVKMMRYESDDVWRPDWSVYLNLEKIPGDVSRTYKCDTYDRDLGLLFEVTQHYHEVPSEIYNKLDHDVREGYGLHDRKIIPHDEFWKYRGGP